MAEGYSELSLEKIKTSEGIGELNRMLRFLFDYLPGDGVNIRVFSGYGSPLNVISAGIGSVYLRADGGAATSLYIKESGTDGSGWVAK